MITRHASVALLIIPALLIGACCTTTPADTARAEAPDRPAVSTAGWESGGTPAEETRLPLVGTMTTAGTRPLSAREAKDEMASLRRANQKLMDQVATMMSNVEEIKAVRGGTAPSAAASRVMPAETASPVRKQTDLVSVRSALMGTGAGDLDVSRNEEGMVIVTLPSGKAFSSGKAELTPTARVKIREIGIALSRSFPGVRIRVEGHTDSDPIRKSKWASNEALSIARAKSVADYLMKGARFAEADVETRGYGDTRPIASNSTREGKAKNRRVELVLID